MLGLEPAYPGAHACGPALTVRVAPGDNLALHHALAGARAGDLLVVAAAGEQGTAHLGDVLAAAALARGVVGVVVDGAIRDRSALAELRFPVFHRGTSPRGPGKAGPGAIEVPVELAGTRVEPGDLVCADADGVAVVRKADRDEVLAAAAALDEREQVLRAAIADGRSTVELLSLPELR